MRLETQYKHTAIGANKKAGFKYFDRETLRFWGVKFGRFYPSEGKIFFAESEDNFDRTARLFKVSCIDLATGRVETLRSDLTGEPKLGSMKSANFEAQAAALKHWVTT